jgi:hypothetical protein
MPSYLSMRMVEFRITPRLIGEMLRLIRGSPLFSS